MYRIIVLLLCVYGAQARYPRYVVRTLSTGNGMPWGGWGPHQFCPAGSWATGFRLQVEHPCGRCDDTALNSVELLCSPSRHVTIRSSTGYWGAWTTWRHCPRNRYLTAYRLDVERRQGRGDDTAANNLNFYCRGLRSSVKYELPGKSPAPWGHSKAWSSSCPKGTAICGIQTKIERPQGRGDDTALNDVRMFCCKAN